MTITLYNTDNNVDAVDPEGV